MKYEEIKKLKRGEFKRLCEVYPETFEKMVKVVKEGSLQKKKGRPSRLSPEDQVLMILEYLRESNPDRIKYINFCVVTDNSEDLDCQFLFVFFEDATEHLMAFV